MCKSQESFLAFLSGQCYTVGKKRGRSGREKPVRPGKKKGDT